jgi:hypothetical protein
MILRIYKNGIKYKLRAYYQHIGRKGGRSGKGASKRRDPGHYLMMAAVRASNKVSRRD